MKPSEPRFRVSAFSLIGAVFLIVVAAGLFNSCSRVTSSTAHAPLPRSAPSDVAPTVVAATAGEIEKARAATKAEAERIRNARGPRWRYEVDVDEMSDGVVRTAWLVSENSFEFDSPYEGRQLGRLMLRKHPSEGIDALVAIERGQILCRYNDCTARVRFDDGEATPWAMNEPESLTNTALFFDRAERFIEQARRSRTVRIELNIFQHPPLVLEFRTQGLNYETFSTGASLADATGESR